MGLTDDRWALATEAVGAERISAARVALAIPSVRAVVSICGVSSTTAGRWLRGDTQIPAVALAQIAAVGEWDAGLTEQVAQCLADRWAARRAREVTP